MKKKIKVIYSVDYETEIEVDTELEEGYYDLEELNNWDNLEEIDNLLKNELSNIPIWEDKNSTYIENSFTVKSIEV